MESIKKIISAEGLEKLQPVTSFFKLGGTWDHIYEEGPLESERPSHYVVNMYYLLIEELEEGAPDLFAELSLVDINVALGSNHQHEKGSWRWSSNDDSVKLHDFARNYFSFFKDNL